MKRNSKMRAVVALTERELQTILVGLRLLLCANVTAAMRDQLPIDETRALARRLARVHATLTD